MPGVSSGLGKTNASFFGFFKKCCILLLLPPESACDSLECQYSSIILGEFYEKRFFLLWVCIDFFDFGGEVVLATG
jgi:hypothetical protein